MILFLAFTTSVFAQDFQKPADRFSKKEMCYFYLHDGTEIQGKIDDLDRKKGLIKQVEIYVDGDKKKKKKLKPADINYMYLKPSGFDKFAKKYDDMFDLQSYEMDRSVDIEKIQEGYVLFESTEVMIKKKKRTLLLQLLNPSFAKDIKVYYDPFARQTASAGIGGMTLAGGDAKSYFVKVRDEVATKVKKKNYKDHYEDMYKGCKDVSRKYKKVKWINFREHILLYNDKCSSK